MKKDIIVYFEDIIESIHKIEEYTKILTKEQFGELITIQDAVLMRFAVIGESANKIPVAASMGVSSSLEFLICKCDNCGI